MNTKQEKMEVCRFCLKNADEFLIIDKMIREILELLVIKVDLNVSHQLVMCYDCANTIQKVFDFKSACIGTEDNLLPFTETKNASKLDLCEIYCKINETEIVDDLLVCRFCMELDKTDICLPVDCLVKNMEMKHLLQKYFFEMVMEHIENPVICHNCLALLQVFLLFTKRHLRSGELIKSDMTVTKDKRIDLKEVENISEIFAVSFKSDGAGFNEVQNSGTNNTKELLKSGHTSCDTATNSDVLDKPRSNVTSNNSDNNRYLSIAAKTDVSENDKIVIEMEEVPYESIEATNLVDVLAKIVIPPEKCVTEQKLECEEETGADNDTSIIDFKDTVKKEVKDITEGPAVKRKKFQCQKCPFKCRGRKRYKKHLDTHDEQPQLQPFKCPNCDYQTIRKQYLNKHMIIHKPRVMIQCIQCDYQSMFQRSVNLHIENIHEGMTVNKKTYSCTLCIYTTKCMGVYLQHIHSHRNISGMLKCPHCDFKTTKMSTLKHHVLQHQTKRQKECDVCPFTCIEYSSLAKHSMSHVCISDRTKVKCSRCEYLTEDKSTLREHCLSHHHWYQCTQCPYKSESSSHLTVHMARHHGSSKPIYKCEVCSRVLKTKRSLKNHMTRH